MPHFFDFITCMGLMLVGMISLVVLCLIPSESKTVNLDADPTGGEPEVEVGDVDPYEPICTMILEEHTWIYDGTAQIGTRDGKRVMGQTHHCCKCRMSRLFTYEL